jgi:PEP-CTERM motif-containing protein
MDAIARLSGIKQWVGLAVVVFGFGSALAAPVTYSEVVSGDLSNTFVGTLDVGNNTIQGTFCTSSTPSPACPGGDIGQDVDSFIFALPSGLVVQNVSFTWQTVSQGLSELRTFFLLLGSASSVSASETVDLIPNGSESLFASALPLTQADNYTIDHLGFEIAVSGSPWSAFVAYTWTLQVGEVGAAQVPEPASLGLLAIALAALGLSRRRKRAVN